MNTNAQIATELLKQVISFLRDVGTQNPEVAEKMNANAATYDHVATLMETDPNGGVTDPSKN